LINAKSASPVEPSWIRDLALNKSIIYKARIILDPTYVGSQ